MVVGLRVGFQNRGNLEFVAIGDVIYPDTHTLLRSMFHKVTTVLLM